ncbi:AIPR family protein [Alteraurantiacibacter buctensis]|uniref:AIPR family protein n=1 Tax=Alteraurantiacibacter buctensis TaxID=1503981 RepID=UPI001927AC00
MKAIEERRSTPNKSWAFLWLILDQFFPSSEEDRIETITDGKNDRGVDAIHIIEKEDSAEVYIFQAKYRDTHSSSKRTINDNEALKICAFLNDLFDRSADLAAGANFLTSQKIRQIWSLHEKGLFCRYKIVFCSNDEGLSSSATSILDGYCDRHEQISYIHYGAEQLVADLGAGQKRSEKGQLQVLGKELFERTDGNVRGVIASVDPYSFIEMIASSDKKSVKRYLFDDNLRIFLGQSGGYNADIIATATSSKSYLFWYLNNGITIICNSYTYNKGHANPVINLEDFQIVNGAQTSHSLMEAYRFDPESLQNVVLLVRIYATSEKDIVESVAVATNSQAKIQNRDLRSNTEVLKKLELALSDHGLFFERKRNMHADKAADSRVDALKLGQMILSYYLNEPERARSESDSIFGIRFNQIFHESYDISQLVRLINLYQKIEELRDRYSADFSGHIESGGSYQYLIYGHWFVLFTIKMLLAKRGLPIPDRDAMQPLIDEAVEVVSKACSQQKSVAHYQMFRSPKTKHKILDELSGKQMELFTILAAD